MAELVIDTTMGFAQIALKTPQSKIYVKKTACDNNQAEKIAVLLQNILLEAQVEFNDITKIYCLIGPGSFTGIRVSIAFIKGLLIGKNIKIIAIPNFYFFISNIVNKIPKYQSIKILIDCGKNKSEFFFLDISTDLSALSSPKIITYDDAKNMVNKNNLIIGNFNKNFFPDNNRNNIISTPYESLDIKNIFSLPPFSPNYNFSPLYIRNSYA